MSLFVLDTDILTLYYHGDAEVVRRIDDHPPSELAITVVTVDKQLSGWYTLTRQARRSEEIARAFAHLGEAVIRLARWRILPYTESAIERVAQWKKLHLHVRLADLRIAAIALENGATVVTRNLCDFGRVPGLSVEDWSIGAASPAG
jgi:tRNA(fMet)-specific endonuclease VapC